MIFFSQDFLHFGREKVDATYVSTAPCDVMLCPGDRSHYKLMHRSGLTDHAAYHPGPEPSSSARFSDFYAALGGGRIALPAKLDAGARVALLLLCLLLPCVSATATVGAREPAVRRCPAAGAAVAAAGAPTGRPPFGCTWEQRTASRGDNGHWRFAWRHVHEEQMAALTLSACKSWSGTMLPLADGFLPEFTVV